MYLSFLVRLYFTFLKYSRTFSSFCTGIFPIFQNPAVFFTLFLRVYFHFSKILPYSSLFFCGYISHFSKSCRILHSFSTGIFPLFKILPYPSLFFYGYISIFNNLTVLSFFLRAVFSFPCFLLYECLVTVLVFSPGSFWRIGNRVLCVQKRRLSRKPGYRRLFFCLDTF